jgi:hypothetical protein
MPAAVGESAAWAARLGRWDSVSTLSASILRDGLRLPLLLPPAAILNAADTAGSREQAARSASLRSSRLGTAARRLDAQVQRLARLPEQDLQALEQQLDQMEQDKMIERATQPSIVGLFSPIFPVRQTRPDGTTKVRVIWDGRPLNQFIKTEHFRLPTLNTVASLLEHNQFMAAVDVRSAYGHVPVARDHRPLLRFVDHRGRRWQAASMPFGLACAPQVWQDLLADQSHSYVVGGSASCSTSTTSGWARRLRTSASRTWTRRCDYSSTSASKYRRRRSKARARRCSTLATRSTAGR